MYEVYTWLTSYGGAFLLLFLLFAGVFGGLLLVTLCDAAVGAYRSWRFRNSDEGRSLEELPEPVPSFHLEEPRTTLHSGHFRPLEPHLTQPFARHVNRVDYGE